MPRLVDGDNLLGTWPGRTRSEAEKRRLVREIDGLTRRDGRRCIVVFDGASPTGLSLGGDVVFSGHGRNADAVILDRLRGESDRRGWSVVTQDRSLADQCRWLGASIESPRTFRERLVGETGPEKPEGSNDVDFWLKQFGEDPDRNR